jgi:glycosyltransferase involved in cell wall biosynthesis
VKISILIPVYNEFPTFPQVLERVRNATLPAGCSREIVVVDDGSTDGTTELIRQHAEGGFITAHYSSSNSGKGKALRIAIELASGDFMIVQDGDLEYDPRDYAKLLGPLLLDAADIVYGSRFLGPAGTLHKPIGMAWTNWMANLILAQAANLLYDARLTDEATAYKAFRADVLRSLRLKCRRFEFCPEVTAKLRRLGYRICEVPITYNARGIIEGKKIRARDGFEALWTLFRYRFTPRRELRR